MYLGFHYSAVLYTRSVGVQLNLIFNVACQCLVYRDDMIVCHFWFSSNPHHKHFRANYNAYGM